MELTYTDASRADIGTLVGVSFNVAFGSDDNDWEMTVDATTDIPKNGLVYILGTEYGGIRKTAEPKYDSTAGRDVIIYGGPSWHGILNRRLICPSNPSTDVYFHVAGDANAALASIISHIGLSDMFAASTDAAGITVSYDFRYQQAYDGICSMLAAAGAKLLMEFDGSHVILSAAAIHDYSADEEFDQSQVQLDVDIDSNPVNHLICLGSGDGTARLRIDLYADVNGNISQTQTITGVDEHQAEYDYTSADFDTLLSNGTDKLQSYLDAAVTIDVTVSPKSSTFDIGDIIGAAVRVGSMLDTVSAYVTHKSATIVGDVVDVDYKAGTVIGTDEEQIADSITAQTLAALNEAVAATKTATQAATDVEGAAELAKTKNRVFHATPTPPYDVGDLWVQGSTGDILVCTTSKEA